MAIKDFFRKREKDAARRSFFDKAAVSKGRKSSDSVSVADTLTSPEPSAKRGSVKEKASEPEGRPTIQVAGKTKYHWRKDVIWEPIITEKTRRLAQTNNTVSFKISPKVGRSEIKEAVEKIFNVKVERVRTQLVKRRVRGRTRIRAVRSTYKKAYVTLKQGSRIALFE